MLINKWQRNKSLSLAIVVLDPRLQISNTKGMLRVFLVLQFFIMTILVTIDFVKAGV